MAEPFDDLDELLAPPTGGETPGLREAVLRRTQGRLARAKWVRRGTRAAAVAALFALGVGAGQWRTPAEREVVVVVREVETVAVPVPVFVPVPVPSGDPTPTVPRAVAAARLELDAEQADDPGEAAKLYRQAGDAYLARDQDYVNAARCYRLFLARSGGTALSPELSDSWLLTSLKNAAFKEQVHATPIDG